MRAVSDYQKSRATTQVLTTYGVYQMDKVLADSQESDLSADTEKGRYAGRYPNSVQNITNHTAKPEANRTPWTTPPQSANKFAKLLIPWSFPKDLAF